MKHPIPQSGDIYGKWEVIHKAEGQQWWCRCVTCGKKKLIWKVALRENSGNGCWKCYQKNRYSEARKDAPSPQLHRGMEDITCPKCLETKLADEFYRCSSGIGGRTSWCKNCLNEREKAKAKRLRADQGPEGQAFRKRHKNHALRTNYGITLDDFNVMLERQNETCAICRNKFSKKEEPCVDHDHLTGKVRGLLCRKCNTLIGLAKEKVTTLLRAVHYLRKHKGE